VASLSLAHSTESEIQLKVQHVLAHAAFLVAVAVNAEASHVGSHEIPALTAAAIGQSNGEVRKVDPDQGKVTLRHGIPINLEMPALAMAFTVADRSLLQGLEPGDKVRFAASNQTGTLVVSAIERTTQRR